MAHKIEDTCIACGVCADTCEFDAIDKGEIYVVNISKCNDCGDCVPVCPVEAIVKE